MMMMILTTSRDLTAAETRFECLITKAIAVCCNDGASLGGLIVLIRLLNSPYKQTLTHVVSVPLRLQCTAYSYRFVMHHKSHAAW